jgi:hypothetical protein
VVENSPSGKLKPVEVEQVKTGKKDTPGETAAQNTKFIDALKDIAAGKKDVNLFDKLDKPPERREAASGRAITAAPGHPIATEEERMRTSRLAQEWNRVDPRGSRWSRLSPRSRSLPTPGGERAGELRRRAFGHEVARIVRR